MGIRFQAVRDFIRRYVTVWRNVWAVRKQLETPPRSEDERAFLPAHLELTETPVSAAPKWTARLIMLFAVLALVWSLLGRIDIVATAQGKTTSDSRSKTIQPLETAVVKKIAVRNGQHVKSGDVLVELEGIGSDSDITQSEQALQAARLSKLRYEAVLTALQQQRPPYIQTDAARAYGINTAALQEAQLLAANQYQAWAAQDAQLQSVWRGHQAELQSVRAQRRKL